MSNPRKSRYLIVLTGSLGDLVRGLPLIDAIKAARPDAVISWLVEDKWQDILTLHPRLDEIIVFNRKQGLAGVWNLFKELKHRHFEVVLDLQRHFKSGIFSRFPRADRRIGFAKGDSKEGNWLFHHQYIDQVGTSISKTEHYLLFLKALEIKRPESIVFGFEQIDGKALAKGCLNPTALKRVGLVLGSSWRSKDWLPSGYAQLIELLIGESDSEIILLGDSSQRSLADQLTSMTVGDRLNNLVARTSLSELVGIIQQCAVVVGPDSGPGHIAAAVGTPYVSLFGATDPRRVAPFAMEELVLRSDLACSPCGRRVCPGLDRLCMRLISAEDVFRRMSPFIGVT